MEDPARKLPPVSVDEVLHRILVGGGLGVGVVLYLYQLFSRNPDQWSGLLRGWGPWFIPAMLGLYFIWDLMKLGVTYVGRLSDGIGALAIAVQVIADKDDRQREEMRLLTQYTARQNDQVIELLEGHGAMIARLPEVLELIKKLPCRIIPAPDCLKGQDGK